MKNLFNSIQPVFGQLGMALMVGLLAMAILPTSSSAQNNLAAKSEMISTVDLVNANWKTAADFERVVVTERLVAAQQASIAAEMVLFTGYGRLLDIMKDDLKQGKPIPGMANAAYNKVLLDAPNDPILKDMVVPHFAMLYAALVSKLSDQ